MHKSQYLFSLKTRLICVALISVLFSCVIPINTKRNFAKAQTAAPLDVVIVPGLPYDTCDMPGLLKHRLYWAKLLYDSGITRHIIFSGSAVYTPFEEGMVMKTMADSIGIPAHHTFAETTAEHSTENLYYSWKMARKMGFKKIGLATDPFQMLLLKRYKRRYCKDVHLIPIDFKMVKWDEFSLPEINPTTAYVHNFVSIMERESFWERARATLGKRIREDIRARKDAEAENAPTSSVQTKSRKGVLISPVGE